MLAAPAKEPGEIVAKAAGSVEEAEELSTEMRYVRGQWKVLGFTLIGFAVLEIGRGIWPEDRDYEWEDFGERFASWDQWLFEDNLLFYNSTAHLLMGWGFYLSCRPYLSRIESFLSTALTSFLFEILLEHKEVVSISDLIVTPFSGAAAGEVFQQLHEYYASGDSRHLLRHKILSVFFNPWKSLDDLLFGFYQPPYGDKGELEVMLYTSLGTTAHSSQDEESPLLIGAGFRMRLSNLPHYFREGRHGRLVTDTAFAELLFHTRNGVDEFRFATHAVWGGYHWQDIRDPGAGRPVGWSVFVGLGTRFDHDQRRFGGLSDWSSTMNILGPALEGAALFPLGYLRLELDAFGDFALPRTLAFEAYKETVEDPLEEGVRGVLVRDYYYGFGVTARARLTLTLGDLRMEGGYTFQQVWAINGQNRIQERIKQDFSDTMHRSWGRVGVQLRGNLLSLGPFDAYLQQNPTFLNLKVEHYYRQGWMISQGVEMTRDESRLMLGAELMLQL